MTVSTISKIITATAVAGLGFAVAGQALAALPPIHHDGGIAYLSGGIGQDEAKAMARAQSQWPVTLEFAVRDGAHADYLANVGVTVRNTAGQTVLQTASTGPFLLAKLSPGVYTVTSRLHGTVLTHKLTVQAGHPAKALFLWPHGTDLG